MAREQLKIRVLKNILKFLKKVVDKIDARWYSDEVARKTPKRQEP